MLLRNFKAISKIAKETGIEDLSLREVFSLSEVKDWSKDADISAKMEDAANEELQHIGA